MYTTTAIRFLDPGDSSPDYEDGTLYFLIDDNVQDPSAEDLGVYFDTEDFDLIYRDSDKSYCLVLFVNRHSRIESAKGVLAVHIWSEDVGAIKSSMKHHEAWQGAVKEAEKLIKLYMAENKIGRA